MVENASTLLVKYFESDVSGWNIMSWANSIEDSEALDVNALHQLRNIDDSKLGYQKEIEASLLKLIPSSNDETLARLLIKAKFSALREGEIQEKVFFNFIQVLDAATHGDSGPSCSWLNDIWNILDGFWFGALEIPSDYMQSIEDVINEESQIEPAQQRRPQKW